MGPIRCPETSVKDYHLTLRNTSAERRSHQHRGGSLKSRMAKNSFNCLTFYRGTAISSAIALISFAFFGALLRIALTIICSALNET
jgi:hypothetical protein